MTEEENTLPAEVNGAPSEPPAVASPNEMILTGDMYASPTVFAHVQRVAKMWADSSWIPERFKGKVADCAVAIDLAQRMRITPFALMQRSYVVQGRLRIEGELVIALINGSGKYVSGVQFKTEGEGDSLKVTAYGVRRDNGEIDSHSLTIVQAKGMGWTKNHPSWTHDPEYRLKLRTATWLGRLYCPELLNGIDVADEVIDMGGGVEVVRSPSPSQSVSRKIRGE